MPQFSHLHCHSQYSLLDGQASIDSLLKKAEGDGMKAMAITDHGNMYGIFDFVAKAWNNTTIIGKDEFGKDIVQPKVKPIIGCELYVVEDRFQKTFTKDKKDKRFHQVMLAKNMTGYHNLVKLTSLGFVDGLYGKYPRVDKQLIEQYHEGLIATTCCLGGSVPQAILTKSPEEAEAEFLWWYNLFGDDYYVEFQRHSLPEQDQVNEVLKTYVKKYNIPYICTNDSHYTDKDDANAHDILLCINTGEKQSTPGFDDFVNDDALIKNRRFKFPNKEFYFKTTNEMETLFKDMPASLENTQQIVDKVEALKLTQAIMLPAFPVPSEFNKTSDEKINQWEYLKALTYEGARRKYNELNNTVVERLEFELDIVKKMGFAGYFLIVWDFIKSGKDMGVYIGPGRGSAAGSAVCYCLDITNIDPIKYDLLFERFLNPERISMPDIDTDFEDDGRQKVIDYVVKKYTQSQVAQIVTYGTMAAKMSIKDVARVLDLPLFESNSLAKMVPDKPGTKLKRVLKAPITAKEAKDGEKSLEEKEGFGPEEIEKIKQLREIYAGDDLKAEVLHEAERLEGCVRNTGMHACGIIIAPKDLKEIVPVSMSKDCNLYITEYDSSVIESAGVIKMDFLGLKNLSILKDAIKLIKQNYDIDLTINDVSLEDEITYALYQRGDTNATFQFESAGMQKYLRELKPDKFADLIAMNALYRPGPIQYIPDFIDRKHGRKPIEYDLPEMEEYLSDTYGITVYQEQVMLLSQKLAGFSKGEADHLRKAMGKKKISVLNEMEVDFLKGAMAKGHPEDKLKKIWEDWKAFAQYAFNKSHSTCYAYVAFQTGYLKAHYPSEYMAAILNHAGDLSKITFYMEECKRMGIKVLGCDINESDKGFSVNLHGHIRFGMGGLKGVGEAAIESIIEERGKNGPYKDIFDFIKRVNQRTVNKRSIESLVYSGAFDCFPAMHRAQFFNTQAGETMNNIERIIKFGNAVQSGGQDTLSLFGDVGMPEIPSPKILPCDEWSLVEKLEKEKDVTGIFISGHPLDKYKFEMMHYGIMPLSEFNELKSGTDKKPSVGRNYRIAGLVTSAQHRLTKTGREFGIIGLEDFSESSELALWSDDYVKFKNYVEAGLLIMVNGHFKQRYNSDQLEFKVTNICLLETVKAAMTQNLDIKLMADSITREFVEFLTKNVKENKGKTALRFKVYDREKNFSVNMFSPSNGVEMNDELCDYLLTLPDVEVNVGLVG